MKGGAGAQYPTMSIDEICDLPICRSFHEDSALFLWVTCPLQAEGMKVMKAWGYEYKTKIYWRKTMSLGMGFWFRGQVEELWLGVRGNVKAFRCQRPNFIQSRVRRHSRKPDAIYGLIEEACPDLIPRVELFARYHREGWDTWGDETLTQMQTLLTGVEPHV